MILKRRTLFWILAGLAAVLLLLLAFRPRPVEVDTGTVTRGRLRTVVEGEARTRVRDLYVVTAPVSGNLQRLTLVPGEPVTRGQVVARIAAAPLDPQSQAVARARLDGAEAIREEVTARIRQARDLAAQSQRTHERMIALHGAGAVSRQELEDAEQMARRAKDELAAAEQRLAAATADVNAARAALLATDAVAGGASIFSVTAPAAGTVLRVPDESQRVVMAGSPLMEIGNPANMEVVIDILSTEAVRVTPGNPVELAGWGGDSTIHATVHSVEPAATTQISALGVEEQRVNVIARFTSHPERLGVGFRADARIVVWEGENILSVPMSALFRSGEGWHTYVVRDGVVALAAVEVGHTSESSAEVLSGLSEGDTVVLFPSDRLSDGVAVRRR